jgi:hypothetical protein
VLPMSVPSTTDDAESPGAKVTFGPRDMHIKPRSTLRFRTNRRGEASNDPMACKSQYALSGRLSGDHALVAHSPIVLPTRHE